MFAIKETGTAVQLPLPQFLAGGRGGSTYSRPSSGGGGTLGTSTRTVPVAPLLLVAVLVFFAVVAEEAVAE